MDIEHSTQVRLGHERNIEALPNDKWQTKTYSENRDNTCTSHDHEAEAAHKSRNTEEFSDRLIESVFVFDKSAFVSQTSNFGWHINAMSVLGVVCGCF